MASGSQRANPITEARSFDAWLREESTGKAFPGHSVFANRLKFPGEIRMSDVTLKGVVANQMDRQLAEMAARQVSGVFSVDNQLMSEKIESMIRMRTSTRTA